MQLGAAFILIKSHTGYARKTGCSRDEAMLTRTADSEFGDEP